MKRRRVVFVALVLVFAVGVAWGQGYNVNNFDVYKYSTDGTPVPDVDKAGLPNPNPNDMSCWQACASNLLAAAGYGVGAGPGSTAQQRGDYIYRQLTADLGTQNMGFSEQAINYWLYRYGKNPDNLTGDYMPRNPYTDVTAMRRPLHLTTVGAPNDYDFLLDELVRCQYVAVSFTMPNSDGHCMTLVGGNYWGNPNNQLDGNKSIWHDSDRDQADVVVTVDDDVYTNAPDANGMWTLSDYVTNNANGYVTLCPGLNKPQYAVEHYDVAYYRSDLDQNGTWDPTFRTAGKWGAVYVGPQWLDDNTVRIGNEEVIDWEKDVYLLVDYVDRVDGRQENIRLAAQSPTGQIVILPPTTVTALPDDGQLLFYWDLPFQPVWEDIIFPDQRYRFLYDPTGAGQITSNVKDWNVATYCDIPEPTTMTLTAIGLMTVAWWRRRRRC